LESQMIAAPAEAAADHSGIMWTICSLTTIAFAIFVLETKRSWTIPATKPVPKIVTDRAEKSCDAVLSVCALLIPVTVGLITWLLEKVGSGGYMIPLGTSLFYFFVLLVFTVHLRFNFIWGQGADFEVSSVKNLRFAYWLTTATSSIVLGLALLAIPAFELGVGILKVKEPAKDAVPKVECVCPQIAAAAPNPSPSPTPAKHSKRKQYSGGKSPVKKK